MTNHEQVKAVDRVIRLLDANKVWVVNRLFPWSDESYKREWYKRDTFRFWCHLDGQRQARLVKLAEEYYDKQETSTG